MVKPMKRIVIWLAATVTIVVLLFGYHTSTNRTDSVTAPAPVTAGSSGSSSSDSGSSGSGSSGSGSSGSGGSGSTGSGSSGSGSSGSGPSGSSSSKTYTGSVAQTRWGPVQVEITVKSGKITKVDVVQYPDGNQHDAEINDYALPVLVQETIKAQSADIDMVSGATVTSDGYVRSLQAALDEAGI
jgi:hypothetical protein